MQPAAIVAALEQEQQDTQVHLDAVISDTRKWEALHRTITDVCELHAKLRRDREVLLEELAVKRQQVQLLHNQKVAIESELHAIEATIGTAGKFVM
jgi:hypothetical protein